MKPDNEKKAPVSVGRPAVQYPQRQQQPGTDPKQSDTLDEQKAMHLTRAFWLAYNSINMYGDQHPQAIRAVESFHAQLSHLFPEQPRILFRTEGDAFFCGTWRVDRELRIQRLVERLSGSGIDSITFESSLTKNGLGLFVTLLVDVKRFRNVSEIEGALKVAETFGIRLNRHKYSAMQVITDMDSPSPTLDLSREMPDLPGTVTLASPPREAEAEGVVPETKGAAKAAEMDEDDASMEIELVPGKLDLGEIHMERVESEEPPEPAPKGQPMMTWDEMKKRMKQEIGSYRGGVESMTRFDRFYENFESMLLRFLLAAIPQSGDATDLTQLTKSTEETDWKLLNELEDSLRDHQLLEEVGTRLQDRFANRVALLWADMIWQQHQPLSEENLPAFFSKVEADLSGNKDGQVFLQSLLYLLDERGLPDKLFAAIWERLVRKGGGEELEEPASMNRLKLPREIETRKEIIRDVETEMYRYNRYTAPFSCLSISLYGIRNDPKGKIRSFNDEELNALFQFLGHELQASLRKLDRVGSLGPMRTNHLLILLPMTDVTGAVVLMERLENRSENWKIVSPDGFFYPVLLFSSFTYNADKIKDVKALLRKIRSKHRKKSDYMSKNVLWA